MPNWCEETEDENENASTDGYLQGLTASGLQHAHELEETSVAVGRARKNQPQGRRKIHGLGIAHIWNQLGAEARQKNRASMACHRMVAGSLFGFRAGLSSSSPRLASRLIATVAITEDGLRPTGRQWRRCLQPGGPVSEPNAGSRLIERSELRAENSGDQYRRKHSVRFSVREKVGRDVGTAISWPPHPSRSPTIGRFQPWRAIIPDARSVGDGRLRQSLRAGRHETPCRCDRPTEQHWRASAFAAPLTSPVPRPFCRRRNCWLCRHRRAA